MLRRYLQNNTQFLMYFAYFHIFAPRKPDFGTFFYKRFETLLSLISKWKPMRRIFQIIRSLICLYILRNKAIRNIIFQESPCICSGSIWSRSQAHFEYHCNVETYLMFIWGIPRENLRHVTFIWTYIGHIFTISRVISGIS